VGNSDGLLVGEPDGSKVGYLVGISEGSSVGIIVYDGVDVGDEQSGLQEGFELG